MVTDLRSRVRTFDAHVDDVLEPWRDRRFVARVFHLASAAGDFSLVWHTINLVVGLAVLRDWRHTLVFAGLIGIESLIVNQGIKRLFRRARPTQTGDPRSPVRRPRTSSFPSGHASSAGYAATLLSAWTGWEWSPLWFTIALVVAISRAMVRIHHASDVVGGAFVGLALAQVVLVWWP